AAAATPARRVLSPPVLLCSGEAEKSRILLAPFADGIASQSAFPFFLFHPGRCLRRKHRKSAPAPRDRLPRLVRPREGRSAPWFPHRNNREACRRPCHAAANRNRCDTRLPPTPVAQKEIRIRCRACLWNKTPALFPTHPERAIASGKSRS